MKSIVLDENEWKLVAALLEMAADQFSNHGCNDLPDHLRKILPDSRWAKIAFELSDDDDSIWIPGDDTMMGYYAKFITKAIGAE